MASNQLNVPRYDLGVNRSVAVASHPNYLSTAYTRLQLAHTEAEAHSSRVKAAANHPAHYYARSLAATTKYPSYFQAESKVKALEDSVAQLQEQVKTEQEQTARLNSHNQQLKSLSAYEVFQHKISSIQSAVDAVVSSLPADEQHKLSAVLAKLSSVAGALVSGLSPEAALVIGDLINILSGILTSGLKGKSPISEFPPLYQESDAPNEIDSAAAPANPFEKTEEQKKIDKELGFFEKRRQKKLEKKALKAIKHASDKEFAIKAQEESLKEKEDLAKALQEKAEKNRAELDAKAIAKIALRKAKENAKKDKTGSGYRSDPSESASVSISAATSTAATSDSAVTSSFAESAAESEDNQSNITTVHTPKISSPITSRLSTPKKLASIFG